MDIYLSICLEVNAIIGGVGMLLSPCTQRSHKRIEKIQLRMMVAMFNGNPGTTIISYDCPTNVSDEKDLPTFYNNLSSLVNRMLKHNILIISACGVLVIIA